MRTRAAGETETLRIRLREVEADMARREAGFQALSEKFRRDLEQVTAARDENRRMAETLRQEAVTAGFERDIRLREAEARVSELQSALAGVREGWDADRAALEEERGKLERLQAEGDEREDRLLERESALQERIDALGAEAEQLRFEMAMSTDRQRTLEEAMARLHEEQGQRAAEFDARLAEARSAADLMKSNLEAERRQRDDAVEAADRTDRQNRARADALEKAVEAAQRQSEESRKRAERAEEEIRAARLNHGKREQELMRQLEKLKSDLREGARKLAEVSRRLQARDTEVRNLQQRAAQREELLMKQLSLRSGSPAPMAAAPRAASSGGIDERREMETTALIAQLRSEVEQTRHLTQAVRKDADRREQQLIGKIEELQVRLYKTDGESPKRTGT